MHQRIPERVKDGLLAAFPDGYLLVARVGDGVEFTQTAPHSAQTFRDLGEAVQRELAVLYGPDVPAPEEEK